MIGLVRLLVVHLMLDRSVTAVPAVRFLDRRLLAPPSKIEAAVAPLPMSRRMQLAQASRLISNSCAKDMKAPVVSCIMFADRVRNKLAHYDPRSGWGVSHVKEISSLKAFEQCVHHGQRALREVSGGNGSYRMVVLSMEKQGEGGMTK